MNRLDLDGKVLFTSDMSSFDTHVMCQLIDTLDMETYLKHMARQRRVGGHGDCTG